MNDPQKPNEQGKTEHGPHVANDSQDGDKSAPPEPPLVNRIESIGTSATHQCANAESGDESRTPEKWWKGFWYDIKATDIAVAFFTAILTVNSCRQNGLMDRSNLISGSAASASKDAAIAAEKTYQFAREGEADAKEALDATKKTALAAQKSADAAQAAADGTAAAVEESRKANVTAQAAAEAASRMAQALSSAVEQARQANVISKQNADAASSIAQWNTFAVERQIRAYLVIDGGSITFDRRTRLCVATVNVSNSGMSMAHSVETIGDFTCSPAETGTDGTGQEPIPPSVGPATSFVINFSQRWPQSITAEEMACGIVGKITYRDELIKPRYTEYKFEKGIQPISETANEIVFPLIRTRDGNTAD